MKCKNFHTKSNPHYYHINYDAFLSYERVPLGRRRHTSKLIGFDEFNVELHEITAHDIKENLHLQARNIQPMFE